MTKKLVKLVPYENGDIGIHSEHYSADGRVVSMSAERLAELQDMAEKAYILKCLLKDAYNNAAKEEAYC